MTGGVLRSISGTIRYTSTKAGRQGAERGREHFRIDVHADGCRTIAAHGEIDDAPSVVRDVNLRVDEAGLPQDCFVRIAVGGKFTGSGWFRFGDGVAECEAMTRDEGRISQKMAVDGRLPAFGNHAMINDGYLLALYDLEQGPGVQVIPRIMLSSPDHRGAPGPLLFPVDVALQYVGRAELTVEAGTFDALHFRMVDVPGLPESYPPYNLYCTADGDYVLLKATVEGAMQTAYELVAYQQVEHGR